MTESQLSAASTTPMDLSGRRFGDYQLLRKLGQGAMADVYLAEQKSLRRRVAFKVLKNHLSSDHSYIQRFRNEAQAAASLIQANIVQVYEVGCIDTVHFIAQEYVPGKNLKQLLRRQGTLPEAAAVNIIRQVGAALQKAGQQGIVHRDVKPENIMLTPAGEVKVADFGLARATSEGDSVDITQIGVTMGTPLYMSPEQIQGEAIDPRSDLYSFGVTCYHMLAGRTPFDGENALAVAVQHLKHQPQPLAALRPDLPVGLCALVHKLLAKQPADRYQTAGEMLRDVRTLQVDEARSGWPCELDWAESKQWDLSDAQLSATRELNKILKSQGPRRRPRRGLRIAVIVSMVFGLVAGAFIARSGAPPPLLQMSPDETPQVPRQKTVQEQYRSAFWIQTPEAWSAVENYFPPDAADSQPEKQQRRYFARLAIQQLAELHLQQGNLEAAWRQFTRLAELEETEVGFKAYGQAGQALVLAAQGDEQRAAEKLALAYRNRQRLNQEMLSRLDQLSLQLRQ